MSADEYEEWLTARHAAQARQYAEQIMSGVRPGDKDLAELLTNLAHIADRADVLSNSGGR